MRKFLSAAAAALLLTSLAGCIDPGPVKTAVPTPSATPVFASDEEALAAAEAAYAAYLAVSDAILQEGGANPDRIDDVATPSVTAEEKKGFADFAEKGYVSSGTTTFYGMQLESYETDPALLTDVVRVYVCIDSSGVDVRDASGASIVPPDREGLLPFEIGFDRRSDGLGALVVSSKSVWGGAGVCE